MCWDSSARTSGQAYRLICSVLSKPTDFVREPGGDFGCSVANRYKWPPTVFTNPEHAGTGSFLRLPRERPTYAIMTDVAATDMSPMACAVETVGGPDFHAGRFAMVLLICFIGKWIVQRSPHQTHLDLCRSTSS